MSRYNETDPHGLCGYIALYQVLLSEYNQHVKEGNPSQFTNREDQEKFRAKFSEFISTGKTNFKSDDFELYKIFTNAENFVKKSAWPLKCLHADDVENIWFHMR